MAYEPGGIAWNPLSSNRSVPPWASQGSSVKNTNKNNDKDKNKDNNKKTRITIKNNGNNHAPKYQADKPSKDDNGLSKYGNFPK